MTSMYALALVAWLVATTGQSRVFQESAQFADSQDKSMTKLNSTKRLADLRVEMRARNISAYIIPSVDAHNSEYVGLHDERRAFISGLTGSAGIAIVTLNAAALWTDGRYYEQAAMEMDSNWILMKKSALSRVKWLSKVLQKNDIVGVDPYLMSRSTFKTTKESLAKNGIVLQSVLPNLVDQIWTNQPPMSNATVFTLSLSFTGKRWQDKVKDLRNTMKAKSATALVLYKLDDIAWLLNLRGSDIPYNPVFLSYMIVTEDNLMLFIDKNKITSEVRKHLSVDDCSSMCVTLKGYNEILESIKTTASNISSKIWLSPLSSEALAMHINESLLLDDYSPVRLPKAIKNAVEIKGMKYANLKDALAFCQFIQWMEKEVPKGRKDLTELLASAKLEEFKSKQKDYVSPSFRSIFGFGPNGAIIHYQPQKSSDRLITTESTLLIDTGSQYKDGTTDTTRTLHFGTPTYEQKVAYTRVLKGVIQLGTLIWPNTTQAGLDIIARKELWAGGLDYRHGTGHGIGMFLNVHEGPQAISHGCQIRTGRIHQIIPGMFTSDEPGYYKTGSFGIRIETVLLAVPAKVKSDFPGRYYVTFEPANLTPLEPKLILVDLLTKKELDYVNDYHRQAREKIGALMKEQKLTEAYNWLVDRTKPLGGYSSSNASRDFASALLAVSSLLVYFMR